MTLYEIDAAVAELIDPETGELLDYEAFEQLQMERNAKIENMALWVKDLTAEANAVYAEARVLLDRRMKLLEKQRKLSDYLQKILNNEKFSTPRCAVTFRRSEKTDVNDYYLFLEWAKENDHEDLLKYDEPDVDKVAVKSLIRTGVHVPGVQIVDNVSMTVK